MAVTLHQPKKCRWAATLTPTALLQAIEKEQMVSSTPDTLLRTDIDASDR